LKPRSAGSDGAAAESGACRARTWLSEGTALNEQAISFSRPPSPPGSNATGVQHRGMRGQCAARRAVGSASLQACPWMVYGSWRGGGASHRQVAIAGVMWYIRPGKEYVACNRGSRITQGLRNPPSLMFKPWKCQKALGGVVMVVTATFSPPAVASHWSVVSVVNTQPG